MEAGEKKTGRREDCVKEKEKGRQGRMKRVLRLEELYLRDWLGTVCLILSSLPSPFRGYPSLCLGVGCLVMVLDQVKRRMAVTGNTRKGIKGLITVFIARFVKLSLTPSPSLSVRLSPSLLPPPSLPSLLLPRMWTSQDLLMASDARRPQDRKRLISKIKDLKEQKEREGTSSWNTSRTTSGNSTAGSPGSLLSDSVRSDIQAGIAEHMAGLEAGGQKVTWADLERIRDQELGGEDERQVDLEEKEEEETDDDGNQVQAQQDWPVLISAGKSPVIISSYFYFYFSKF
jgi:hypothetical protein